MHQKALVLLLAEDCCDLVVECRGVLDQVVIKQCLQTHAIWLKAFIYHHFVLWFGIPSTFLLRGLLSYLQFGLLLHVVEDLIELARLVDLYVLFET